MGFMKSLQQRVRAALNPRSEPRWESIKIDCPRSSPSPSRAPGMGDDYYTQPVGSERHREAYRAYTEATGGPRDGWTVEQEYTADNYAELAWARREQEYEAAARLVQSPSMERHPYTWSGTDAQGEHRQGDTLMRDKTVPAMVEGFRSAGYRQLGLYRQAECGADLAGGFGLGRDQRQA